MADNLRSQAVAIDGETALFSSARAETARLAALGELRMLDNPPDERIDRIVRLAATTLEMPISLVSLVDAERQWFAARFGLDATETPRCVAFCDHAIRRSSVMVVPDALRDPRFSANPLVTGAPNVRFYAGAPLATSSGQRVGTLCLIDTVERTDFGPQESAFLTQLASIAMLELELRADRLQLASRAVELDHIFASLRRPARTERAAAKG